MNYLDSAISYIQKYALNPELQDFLWPIKAGCIFFSVVFAICLLYFYKTSQYWNVMFYGDLKEFLAYKPSSLIDRKKKWDKIKKRMSANIETEWKLALIEADEFFYDAMADKFNGEEYTDLFEQIKPIIADFASDLIAARELRDKIVQNSSMVLEKNKAEIFISAYENALKKMRWI